MPRRDWTKKKKNRSFLVKILHGGAFPGRGLTICGREVMTLSGRYQGRIGPIGQIGPILGAYVASCRPRRRRRTHRPLRGGGGQDRWRGGVVWNQDCGAHRASAQSDHARHVCRAGGATSAPTDATTQQPSSGCLTCVVTLRERRSSRADRGGP